MNSYLGYFPVNFGVFCEEQGERFHQDICEMENKYQEYDENMMAGYSWNLKHHNPTADHKKESKKDSSQVLYGIINFFCLSFVKKTI